ncbi:MAG: phosphatidylserine/phosphatidylglycerophosphate/cardiolipin synthase family protein [Gemmatimonadetes bacterium]|nr:phosphatidylserine/phosphatidylglycerophosphate/cardiolipin synthase family protein [Gemmatimonadota bacterium]
MTSADVSPGNRVTLFSEGGETFDAMIALIDGAQRTVDLESYIFRDDAVGDRFASALTAAEARGVRVRVLCDWIGARGTDPSFLARLTEGGVDVRVFNTPGWKRWLGLIPRDHRKLLVVDGSAGVTGGVGIGSEWFRGLLKRHSQAWRDRCVRIVGPAAEDMQRAYDTMWRRAAGERMTRAERRMRRMPRNPDLEPGVASPALVAIVEGEPGRFRVGRALHLQAAAATKSIWVASAYFIPSFAEVDSLTAAARDGVDVRLLLPSNNDHPWVNRFSRRFYPRLLANGVRIWEWSGEMMHAKTSVVDGTWTRVGSTDFNPLGVAINYELDAYIEDTTVAQAAERLFLADLDLSKEIKPPPYSAG